MPPLVAKFDAHGDIGPLASAWDRAIPRDLPHLRAGFLRAVQTAAMVDRLTYFTAFRGSQLVACAVVFDIPLDTIATAPPFVRRLAERIRQRRPQFLWKAMRVCGSPISNGEDGLWIDPTLPLSDRRELCRQMIAAILKHGGIDKTYFFKEFAATATGDFGPVFEAAGFFPNDPWSGTRLDVAWPTFEAYQAALRKKYRKRVRQEIDQARDLEFSLLEEWTDLAPQAEALYGQVMRRAAFVVERASAAFFREVSQFEQARLLVARSRESGELLGVNLLMFGDTVMHNLYIGFDYAANEQHHTYFNLVIRSLREAIDRGVKTCFFGQDSYEFKARLGARPIPLTAFLKHRLWPVHAMLKANRRAFFPPNEAVEHDVFMTGGREGEEA